MDGHAALFVQEAGAGESQQISHSDSDADVYLEAASDGWIVTRTLPDPQGQSFLEIRDNSGSPVTQIRDFGVDSVARDSLRSFAPRKVLKREKLLTVGPDFHVLNMQGDELFTIEVTNQHRISSRPVLYRQGVAYTAAAASQLPPPELRLSPADVFVYEPGTERQQITSTPQDERYVFADGSVLYWMADDGIYKSASLDEPIRIFAGQCGPPHASNGKAAFACAATDDGNDATENLRTSRLFVYDGSRTREIPLVNHPRLVRAVRVTGSGVAWFEFDDPDAICQGSVVRSRDVSPLRYRPSVEVRACLSSM